MIIKYMGIKMRSHFFKDYDLFIINQHNKTIRIAKCLWFYLKNCINPLFLIRTIFKQLKKIFKTLAQINFPLN